MSGPSSGGESSRPVRLAQALVIDLALILYLVFSAVFVGHTVYRSYDLLDRNGYFAGGEHGLSQLDFAYFMVARGIESNNLGNTTSYLLGSKPLVPGPNKGWTTRIDADLQLELRFDPIRGAIDIHPLDGPGGRGIAMEAESLQLEIGGKTYDIPQGRTTDRTTRYALQHRDFEGLRSLDAKVVSIESPSGTKTGIALTAGADTPPIQIIALIGFLLALIWSGLGWAGIFHSPAQRMFGLAPRRELAPDERAPSFLRTFNGLFLVACVLLTIAAGWLMIEVNLTTLTSDIRLNRMKSIFAELFDFANIRENWNRAVDGDPTTNSSWNLFEDAVPKMIETLFLAMMATLFAIPIAFCLSFLGARNLMQGNPVSMAIYTVTRMLMNIVRSVEPLAWCIIASVWVGAGTFAGVLALSVHSIAALTKLYSEQIEGVDPGPMEAIRATGASGLQVLRFGVVPQIIPPFLSFTMYRWDINVRMAPILGFVGGGGIGVLLKQNFDQLNYANVGVIILLITILVAAMDFASAHLRAKLI